MEILELDRELWPIGTTPVHVAISSGQTNGLLALLDGDNSSIDTADQYGRTPLVLALQNGRLDAAQILIQRGARLDVKFGEGGKNISTVLVTSPTYHPLAHSLIETNIALPCDLSSFLPTAAYEGNADLIDKVVSRYKCNVDYRDRLGCTALHYASQKGFSEIAKLLLVYKASRTITTSWGSTALHLACTTGHLAVVVALLDPDLSPESIRSLINTKNASGLTPLVCALTNGHFELVLYILTTHSKQVDFEQVALGGHFLPGLSFYMRFLAQPSPVPAPYRSVLPCLSPGEALWMLHESVCANDTEALGSALAQGATTECLDFMQQTPLIVAAKLGHVEACKSLIQSGADPCLSDWSGKTALEYAIDHNRDEVAAYLLSYASVNPCSLTAPLGTAVLAVMASHLESNQRATSPTDWLVWLALATPTASKQLLSTLVSAIAPPDWIQQILAMLSHPHTHTEEPATTTVRRRAAKLRTLPVYIQEVVEPPPPPKPKLVRSFSQPRKWYFARPPPSTSLQWSLKHLPQPKKVPPALKSKGRPFLRSNVRAKASVIHEAALHNIEVLSFILSTCDDPDLQAKVLLSKDEMGRTALELALPHFVTISEAVEFFRLTDCTALDEFLNKQYPLPDAVLFEEALVQYLCLGKNAIAWPRKVQSPLQAWPLWYLQQQVNGLCSNLGADLLSVSEEEDRMELLQLLLDQNFFPHHWTEEAYPPPLFVAIRNNCTWAVAPLLLHGADPATHYKGRLALEEAAKRCQIQTIELLVQNGYAPFLSLSNADDMCSSICSTLVTLANDGHLGCAVKLVQGLSLSQHLWPSRSGPNLLLTAQAKHEGSGMYETILLDFVAFFNEVITNWETTSSDVQTSVLRSIKHLHKRSFLARASESTRKLQQLISLVSEWVKYYGRKADFGLFFHFLCAFGCHDVVSFMLECYSSVDMVNKLDTSGRAPLFYAACSGHLSIVQLLLQHGARLDVESSVSPLIGALLYLACAPCNVGGDILGKTYVSTGKFRQRYITEILRVLPSCYFSPVCDDIPSSKQLVSLLLPPKSVSILSHLASAPNLYKPLYMEFIIVLLACARYSTALEPLLRRITQESIPTAVIDNFGQNLTDTALGHIVVEGKSVLGEAIMLAPPHSNSEASQQFESFLAHFASQSKLQLSVVFSAAKKGYWSVLYAAVSTNGITYKDEYESADSHVRDSDSKHLYNVCLLAVQSGQLGVVQALLEAGQSSHLFQPQWWPRLVSTAVRRGHLDIVREAVGAGCDPILGLRAAARWGKVEALELLLELCPAASLTHCFVQLVSIASQCNQQSVLQSLLTLYQRNELEIKYEGIDDRNVSFWFCVLLQATKYGQEYLALQAVACISESQMNSEVSKHQDYFQVLYYSCYWGLTELLQCIPYLDSELTIRRNGSSPLEAALANGKLSSIPGHPGFFFSNLQSWLKDSPLVADENESENSSLVSDENEFEDSCLVSYENAFFHALLTGYFHQLCSYEPQNSPTSSGVEAEPVCKLSGPSVFFQAIEHNPRAFAAFQKLAGKHTATLMLYALDKCGLNLVDTAVLAGNASLLEQVLHSLYDSGLLESYCSKSQLPVMMKAVQCGSAAITELLLRCGDVFVKQLASVDHSDQNILHIAVRAQGHSTEVIELVLAWLGDSASDLCVALDSHGHHSLYLAFNLGKYERAAKLLEIVYQSTQVPTVEPDWKPEARKARGWYRFLAQQQGRQVTDEEEPDCVIGHFNIRIRNDSKLMFKYACQDKRDELVEALLVASCGQLLEDKELLQCGLLNQSVLEFLSHLPPYVSVGQLDATDITCKAVERGSAREVEFLLKLLSQQRLQISVNQTKVFLAACTAGSQPLVQYFLQNVSLNNATLREGITQAINVAAYEVAAIILLAAKVPPNTAVDVPSASLVVRTIFISDKDYHTIVEDFFGSLARVEPSRCLPFSEAWLAHRWGPRQAELLGRRLGNAQVIPSNPWTLGVQWRNEPLTIPVTINWESFAECMLGSTSQMASLPLLLEAVVFSSAVLGQLCVKEEGENYNMSEFFDCTEPLSSLVISAVTWPHPPSAGLTFTSDGLLTLSYKSEDRVLVFPPLHQVEKGIDESYSTDSGLQSICYSELSNDISCDSHNKSTNFSERFTDLCKFYEVKLKKNHKTSTNVEVEGFSWTNDYLQFSVVYSVLLSTLDYCSEALKLAWLPPVAYSNIHRGNIRCPLAPPGQRLFSHIGINLSTAEKEKESSSAVVSLVDTALDFSFGLSIDSITSPPSVNLPCFDSVLQQTVTCLLTREGEDLKHKFMKEINRKIIPTMEKGLRCSIDGGGVEVFIDDNSGTICKLRDTTLSHLSTLKALPQIARFLRHFSDVFVALSKKPKLISNIHSFFQAGFKIVVSEQSPTSFAIDATVPQLTILMHDLQYPQSQTALLSISSSIVEQASSREQSLKDVFTDVPCPFLTHVDLDMSKGFLFPSVDSTGKLVVQVVSYEQQRLHLPLKYNCCLKVAIRSPTLKILRASSSEDPGVSSASKRLFIAASEDGQFEVCWTPQEEGIHCISLSLNGAKIQEFLTRIFVSPKEKVEQEHAVSCNAHAFREGHWAWTKGSGGKRQAQAGTPIVFTAAHVGPRCSCNGPPANIVLAKHSPVELSPFLKSPPGFGTFVPLTSPPPATTTSSVNASANLKEIVSAMSRKNRLHDSALPLLHHLSVTSAYGGSKRWMHVPTSAVTVHITTEEKKKAAKHRLSKRRPVAHCLSLGNGMYRVALQCNFATTYKVFASCPTCQSVMKIFWSDEDTFFPQPFYILPGPFSAAKSYISTYKENVSSTRAARRKQKAAGGHSSCYKAGQTVTLYLKVCDNFGNAHSSGGAVKKAVVSGAGKASITSESSLEVICAQSLKRPESVCSVEHHGDGLYQLQCTVYSAGNHPLLITHVHGKTVCITTLQVQPSTIYPPHCRLEPNNNYTASIFEEYSCHMYTYDEYFNPCRLTRNDMVHAWVGAQNLSCTTSHNDHLEPKGEYNRVTLKFSPQPTTATELWVKINGVNLTFCPVPIKIGGEEPFKRRLERLRRSIQQEQYRKSRYAPTITIERSNIMESALRNAEYFYTTVHVRFGDEPGVDLGGVAREFFHILCLEFINPQYALFQSVNGLIRPSPCSSVNPNHLIYFHFFGKVLARMICDRHQTTVRFTPAVYKYLLQQECTLDDLKIEDPSLHKGLMEIANCETEEALEHLACNFTASRAHFGVLETVELEKGGTTKEVTLKNKWDFVNKLYKWHLIGCVSSQLQSLKQGFNTIIPHVMMPPFSAHELEVILSGQPKTDLSFMKLHTRYSGYGAEAKVVTWLWDVLESFSQEEKSEFLQFTTGCACLPSADVGQWKMEIKRGFTDDASLPTASTCVNSLTVPQYTTKDILQQKLKQALGYGQQTFLIH